MIDYYDAAPDIQVKIIKFIVLYRREYYLRMLGPSISRSYSRSGIKLPRATHPFWLTTVYFSI